MHQIDIYNLLKKDEDILQEVEKYQKFNPIYSKVDSETSEAIKVNF